MEELSKQQLVLLTLLVSFVTSIATGIVTVSLVSQAPAGVTQTINRVVQQTVEQIVPGTSTTTTVTNTVIENNDTAATTAIALTEQSLVRLSDSNGFAGLALVDSKGGQLITTASLPDPGYQATFSDGGTVNYAVASSSGPFTTLVLVATSTRSFMPVSFAPKSQLLLGRSIIGLTGQNSTVIRIGAIGSIDTASSTITAIYPTFTLPDEIFGSPLILLSGQVAGMLTVNADGTASYLPSPAITSALSAENN